MSYEPPPPPPGGGYGQQPGYGAPQPQSTSVLAVVSLVTGILGVFPCCGIFVFSIAAAITGFLAKKEIAESSGAKKGAGLAQAGFILGIVGLALGGLYWILVVAGTLDFNTYSN
jgi:hypothetical protein